MSFTDTPPTVVAAAEAEPLNRVHCSTNGQGALSANIAPHQTNEKEEWRTVPSFPDYEVSDHGRVRRVQAQAGKPPHSIVASSQDKGGYLRTWLWKNNTRSVRANHSLVCEAFFGPRPSPQHDAAHNDGNKLNNHVSNLRWATKKENQADRRLHGYEAGPLNKNKLTTEQVHEIRRRHEDGQSIWSITGLFPVSRYTILAVVNRRIWRHV